ncbi:MAG: hypothetical protein K2X27_09770 [Candidatus Obscuribacterales bacterium]|nr:hypothetical protein [Candidatus Obscuribacterales bacterium]
MKTSKSRRNNISRKSGQSIVELGVGLMLMIPILLFGLNCLYVGIGASLNEYICRDAARAAASGPPSMLLVGTNRNVSSGAPKERVLSVIKKVYYSGLPMKVREDVILSETVRDLPPKADGGAIDGEVTVTTTIDIYPPVQVQGLYSRVVLKSKHRAAITYVLRADT